MKRKLLLSLLPVILCLSGCVGISHVRESFDPATGKVVSRETEGANAFLMKGQVDKLNIKTKDGGYSHSFSGSGAQASGDVEMIRELRGLAKDSFEAGANAASKSVVPVP